MAEVAQGVVALIPSARGFSDLLHKEIGGGLTKAGEKGGEAYGKGMKGKVSGLAKGVFAPMLAAGSTVAIAGLLKSSVGEAREAQKVGAITSQIIKSTGGAAKVTSDQVGSLSEKLSLKSGVDDEVIQSGANMLLTFKQVRNEVGKGNDIFDRATAAASDLSAAGFGDMAGQSKMLGKALNDPIKGMTALTRSGVTFTDQQKAQIKAMQKGGLDNAFGAMGMEVTNKELEKLAKDEFGGDIAKAVGSLQKGWSTAKKKRFDYYSEGGHQLDAQKVLLKEVESQVGGTAAAQATAGEKAQVAWGNLQETIGTGLLPVIDKMQNVFTTKIAPAVSGFVQGMQDGSGAGGTFVDVLTKVKNIVTAIGGFLIEHRKSVLAIVAAYAAFKVAAATMRLFNAVVLFGKGVQQGYALATYGSTAATKANTVAEKIGLIVGKAKLIMMKAVTIATKAWAVAQRVLNAVMRMNPIGLVVTALIALGAGMVIAYKKSETFRRIVDAAWAGIKKAAMATVGWFKNTAWPWMKAAFTNIGNAAKWLWKNGIKPAFDGIRAVISWWYTNVVKRYFALVKTAFTGLAATAKWLWQKAIKPAFTGIVTVASWLWKRVKQYFTNVANNAKWLWGHIKSAGSSIRGGFQAIGDKAKWLWDKGVKPPFNRMKAGFTALKDAAVRVKDAISKQFGKIRDGIQKPLRQVMTFIDKKFISKVKGMLHGVGLGSLSAKIPYLTPGGKGYAVGGYTGPGSKYAPAGVVHKDEFVLRKESVNKLRKTVGLSGLDHMNRTGELPGYAIGGKVSGLNKKFLDQLGAFNDAAGGRFSVNSGYRSNAHQQILYNNYLAGRGPVAAKPGSSQHNKGLAADLAPSNARDTHAALARKHGLVFTVPSESWHIEPSWGRSGGDKGGSFVGNALSGFAGKVFSGGKEVLSKILDTLPGHDTFWGKTAIAPMRMVSDGVFSKFKEAASVFGNDGGSGGSGSAPGGGVERWRPTVLKALGMMGLSDKYANSTLRRMNQESGGNPRAINNWDSNASRGTPSKGLMQVIDPTFRAYAKAGYNKDIFDPLSNILASMRYAQSTYGTLWAAYDRKGGYSSGGLVTPPVFDNGGTLAPGLNLVNNKLGRPEALVRPEHMGAPQVNISFAPGTEWLADFVQSEITYASDFDRAIGRAV